MSRRGTRRYRFFITLFAVTLGIPALTVCQATGDVTHTVPGLAIPMQPVNAISLGFDKLLDTYHWNGQLRYLGGDGPFNVALSEQSFSTLILSDHNLTRDEHSFGLGLRQRFFDKLSGAVQESSYVLSDNRNLAIGSASAHALYGGMDYRPFDQVLFEPLAGYRFDNQVDQQDRGPSYQFNLLASQFDLGGGMASFGGHHRIDKLDPRILETHLDTFRISRDFAAATRNALQISFNRSRRDFYFPADASIQSRFAVANNIQTRTEDVFVLGDSLQYPVSPQMQLGVQGMVYNRGIEQSVRYQNVSGGYADPVRNINEFRLDGNIGLAFNPWRSMDGMVQLGYQERNEEHSAQQLDSLSGPAFATINTSETRKNNQSRRTALMLQLNAGITDADSISLGYSTGILRYDTPSLDNTDDRDELRDIASLTVMHRFSPYFSLAALGEVTLDHLVYLSSQRSADNAWNRIYRFAPQLSFAPSSSFTTFNAFEVLANYTIYDFDYASSAVRSFTFRQFAFTDSTLWMLTNRVGLQWFSNIRFYERGELQWQAFSERPLTYFEDKTYIGTVRCQPSPGMRFAVGFRYFSQWRRHYEGTELLTDGFLRSVGPISTIELNFGSRTRIFVNGWYEHQVQDGQQTRDLATLTMSCSVII